MHRTITALALLLLMASTAAPRAKSRSWLHGVWEGTGYQTDTDSTWPMKLTITKSKRGRRNFSIDYPSLKCGGRWKLLSINQNRARFRERLDHGQDECDDNGLVVIERRGRQLLYLYSIRGRRELTASAVLNRKRSASKQ